MRERRVVLLKAGVWVLGLYPLARVGYWILTDGLGADPVARLLHHSGWWALVLLLVALAVTPLRRLSGWNAAVKARRPLGLFAFFYACLHFGWYLVVDQGLALEYIVEDIVERPFITIGFLAWLLLVPLALTSTKGWIRRLGRRWTTLHRLAYVAPVLGVIHYYWRIKVDTDTATPLLFAAVLAVLLAARVPAALRGRRRRHERGRAPSETPTPA